jgi:Flp pilus assembly protein TadG
MKALWRDRRGVAALEMALITTFLLLPLTAGVVGSGQAILTQYRVDRALHAGLMYAWGLPTATTSAIQTAATAGSGANATTVSATASIACYCISPTGTRGGGTSVSCPGSCTSPQVVATYATVTTTAGFTPIFPTPWGTAAWTLSATGTVRVQ